MERYIRRLISHRIATLIIVGAISVLAVSIAVQGQFASSVANLFFGEDHAGFNAYRQRIREFANDQVFIVMYADADLLSEASLNRLQGIMEQIRALPDVERIDSLLNAQHIYGEEDTLYVEKYADEARRQPNRRQELLAQMQQDALLHDLLLSPDGRHAAVIIELTPDEERSAESGPILLNRVRNIFLEGGFTRDHVKVVGLPATLSELIAQTHFNISRLFPFVCLLLVLVVYLMFHRLWPVMITLLVSLIAVVWTYGFAVLLDRNINIFIALSPAIIIIVATSDVIHLCSAYLLELGSGKPKAAAIVISCAEVGTACFWTSATTFVGFVSMVFVPVPAFRQLGLVLGTGVGVSLLLAMTLTPIFFSFLPPPTAGHFKASRSQRLLTTTLSGIEQIILYAPWSVVIVFACCFGLAIWGLMSLDVETNFSARLDEENWVRRDERDYRKHFAGANFLDVFLDAPPADELLTGDLYSRIQRFQQQMEQMPEVDKVVSLVDLIDSIDCALSPEMTTPRTVWTRELLAQYLLLFEMSGGEDLERFVSFDRRTMRFAVRLAEDGIKFTYLTGEQIAAQADAILDGAARVQSTGLSYLMGEFIDEIVIGQKRGVVFAFATILVMMALMFRSLKIGLWSMAPNTLPVLALGGYLGYFWDAVDSDATAIAMIAIGIGVDDTIHFLTRLRFESARTTDPVLALQRTFHFSGRAMVITTVVLTIGFAPFMLSDYLSVWMFGTLLPFTLVVALLADILLVPALVKLGVIHFKIPSIES